MGKAAAWLILWRKLGSKAREAAPLSGFAIVRLAATTVADENSETAQTSRAQGRGLNTGLLSRQ